ncbi:MAG TPA: biotin/lipoyl-binding protein, partial [Fimbriimonadaceae bacterium]|nr:biotin/lipoyl-binding protein [Fimbriimonadaceae bacterium]
MNKKPIVAVVVLAAVLAGGYYIDRQRTAKESRLSGFFESQPSQAASRSGGRVVKILVREGDSVKAGQPLVQLEDAGQTDTYRAQESATEQAWQQFLETQRGSRPEEIDKARHAV